MTTANSIVDIESLKIWLNQRPETSRSQEAVVLAHRSSMRGAPFFPYSSLALEGQISFAKSFVRGNVIARVATFLDSHEIKVAAAAVPTSRKIPFDNSATFSANAAAEALDPADAVPFALMAVDNSIPKYLPIGEDSSAFWRDLRFDAGSIEDGKSTAEIMRFPLWTNVSNHLRIVTNEFAQFLSLLQDGVWLIWAEWYFTSLSGKPTFQIGVTHIARNLERNIALGSTDGKFNKGFWEQEPAEINATVKRWVAEAREMNRLALVRAPSFTNDHVFGDQDFRSKAASIETVVLGGRVELAQEHPLSDLTENSVFAVTKDLANALRSIAKEAEVCQADRRIIALLRDAATAIEGAAFDQQQLFESGRNKEVLEIYAASVDAEWNSVLAAQFHGLTIQFGKALDKFPAWREFSSNPARPIESVSVSDMANAVESVVAGLIQHKPAFSERVLARLQSLATRFRISLDRIKADDPSNPFHTVALDSLQSDLATSLSNVLLSYLQSGFHHYGSKILDGANSGFDKVLFVAGFLAVMGTVGAGLKYLQELYPDLFSKVTQAAKSLRKIVKDTEPD